MNSANSIRFYGTVGTVQERRAWHSHSGMVGTALGTKADEGAKMLISFLSMTVGSSANEIGSRPHHRTVLEASTSPAPPSANIFGKGRGGGGMRDWKEPPCHCPHHYWAGCSVSQLKLWPGGGGILMARVDHCLCCSRAALRRGRAISWILQPRGTGFNHKWFNCVRSKWWKQHVRVALRVCHICLSQKSSHMKTLTVHFILFPYNGSIHIFLFCPGHERTRAGI
jgi:hypothetical protein